VTVIYPCTQSHIQKYSAEKRILFRETPAIYERFTKQFILGESPEKLGWLYQLLDKTAEQDRFLLEDPDLSRGFVIYAYEKSETLLSKNIEKFSALVLVHRKDLKSIRDLDLKDVPLLQNIKHRIYDFVDKTFGETQNPEIPRFVTPANDNSRLEHTEEPEKQRVRPRDQIRIFFHYKPTYFHLHLHVAHISSEKNEKDHRLDDVIEHLQLFPNYYQQKTLIYELSISDPLYLQFCTQ